jgi:hypothetical protein
MKKDYQKPVVRTEKSTETAFPRLGIAGDYISIFPEKKHEFQTISGGI